MHVSYSLSMRKVFAVVLISMTIMAPIQRAHALDPKSKAFAIICGYGTIGGALLGFASMAFGSNSRAIAQGASLGLYSGIIFGSYIIASHRTASQGGGYEENSYAPPAPDAYPPTDSFGQPVPQQEEPGGFFDGPQRYHQLQGETYRSFKTKKRRFSSPPIYLNLVNYNF